MKKTAPLYCLLFLSSSALANEHVYSSLQIGKANHELSQFDQKIPLDIKPYVIGINTAVLYGEDKLKFGYNVSLNFMYEEDFYNTSTSTSTTKTESKATITSWGGDVAPLISYHLTENFNIHSKVGLSYTSTSYEQTTKITEGRTVTTTNFEIEDRKLGYIYALGFNYKINETYFIGAEYKVNNYEFDQYDIKNELLLVNLGIHI